MSSRRRFHEWARADVGRRTVCGLGVGAGAHRHAAIAYSVVSDLGNVEAADRCGNCLRMRSSIGTSSQPAPEVAPIASVTRGATIDELAASLTERELDVMMHATGWESRSPLYRNHYCASEGDDAWSTIQALIARGLMRQSREPSELSGGDNVFSVTAIGIATLRGKRRPPTGEGKQSGVV